MQDTPRRRTNSAHVAHVPARLQATWAELVRWQSVSCVDKIYIFEIVMKNCLKYPSPVKFRDVAGTPNLNKHTSYLFSKTIPQLNPFFLILVPTI